MIDGLVGGAFFSAFCAITVTEITVTEKPAGLVVLCFFGDGYSFIY